MTIKKNCCKIYSLLCYICTALLASTDGTKTKLILQQSFLHSFRICLHLNPARLLSSRKYLTVLYTITKNCLSVIVVLLVVILLVIILLVIVLLVVVLAVILAVILAVVLVVVLIIIVHVCLHSGNVPDW